MKISALDSINILGYIFYSDDSLKQLSTGKKCRSINFFVYPGQTSQQVLVLTANCYVLRGMEAKHINSKVCFDPTEE